MANKYTTSSVEITREEPSYERTVSIDLGRLSDETLRQAAVIGLWLKASADISSKCPKGTDLDVRVSTIAERVEEILAANSFERERAQVSRKYVDENLILAISQALKVSLEKARASYAKSFADVSAKADVQAKVAQLLAKNAKIASAYKAIVDAKNASVDVETGDDLFA